MAIVTDSSSCLPQEVEKLYQIEVVPYNIHNQGETYLDGVDINPEQIYSLQRSDIIPTTSPPSPGTLIETFHRLSQRTKDEAKELGQRLTAEFKRHGVYVTEVSAVVATHIVPKAMGIAFCAED